MTVLPTVETLNKRQRWQGATECVKHLIDLVREHRERAPPEALAVLVEWSDDIRLRAKAPREQQP